MKAKIFLIITTFAIISLSSCKKDSVLDQTSIDLADDDAVSDAIFEDVFNTVDYADIMLDGLQKGESAKSEAFVIVSDSCPAVTITHPSDAIWPKTITVDYGTGCTGFFENTRAGKIIITVTGPRRETGSKRSVTFDNYYINGIKVEGTHEVEITGTATGVNINGVAYTKSIMTALHWQRVCRFVVSGVVKIEMTGSEPFEINFGTGDCDAVATVTRGDDSKEITLRYRHRLMGN
jgi:hypothetical protein